MKRLEGFTLLEAMITVVILGVLAAIAIPAFGSYVYKSRVTEATTFLSDIKQRQEAYRDEFGQYCPVNGIAWGEYNPTASPGNERVVWVPTPAWAMLGATPDAPTFFQYATIAGAPGQAAPTETNLDINDHWFAARALGDLDDDGTDFFLEIYSQSNHIFNSAQDTGGWE